MVPDRRTSRARKRKRASHHALSAVQYQTCPKCQGPKLSHVACDRCGYVNSRLSLPQEKKEA